MGNSSAAVPEQPCQAKGQKNVTFNDAPARPPKRAEASSVSDVVVDASKVIAQKGSNIAIASRYSVGRPLTEDYEFQSKVLGSGMSGPVQLVTRRIDQRPFAVKSFNKKGLSVKKRADLKSEVETYLLLDHPHIAKLEMVYEVDEAVSLVMEFMAGGELYDRLSAKKQYTEAAAANATYQMLLAVNYLHANRCVHRDLKLENFMYESKDSECLKLIDFGFAKIWDGNAKMKQACGSVHYVAPEVLAHAYTEKADMWSLGVIVYMLLAGSPPFSGDDSEILKKIKECKPHWSSRFNKLSDNAKNFVKKLLVKDPVERLSASEALEHPFVKERHSNQMEIDPDIILSLRNYAHRSAFKRAIGTMMAWSLSAEDHDDVREMFLAMDKDKKGTISHSQMKEIFQETFHIDSERAEGLFQSLDADNDGEIAYTEFLSAVMQDRIRQHEDVLRKVFAKFDPDNCGYITVDDLRYVIGDEFDGEDVEDLIQEADPSANGKISYDEFLQFLQRPDEEVFEEDQPEADEDAGVKSMPLPLPAKTPTAKHIFMMGRIIDKHLDDCTDPGSPTFDSGKAPILRYKDGARRSTRAKTVCTSALQGLPIPRERPTFSSMPKAT